MSWLKWRNMSDLLVTLATLARLDTFGIFQTLRFAYGKRIFETRVYRFLQPWTQSFVQT